MPALSPVFKRVFTLSVIILATGVALEVSGRRVSADEAPTLYITVHEFVWQQRRSFRALETTSGTLSLHLKLTNDSSRPVTLSEGQVSVVCNGQACRETRVPDAILREPLELAEGDSVEGWVAATVRTTTAGEPRLRLRWKTGDTEQELNLNEELRRVADMQTERLGPNGILSVVSFRRTIDAPMIWLLDERLRELKQNGVERVVLDARVKERVRLRSEISLWLMSARRVQPTAGLGFRPPVNAPVQFSEFHVSGLESRGNDDQGMLHETRELAVAAALSSVYDRLPIEESLRAIESDDGGIRRVALISSIDRMTSEQLERLLNRLERLIPTTQILIIEQLDRVTHPIAEDTLRGILLASLSGAEHPRDPRLPKPAVAAAARTLIRCIGPRTESTVADVWTAAGDDSLIQEEMVQEILATGDCRWIRQTSEFATHHLNLFSSHNGEESESETHSGNTPSSLSSVQRSVTESLLASVLRFLHTNDRTFIDVARVRLLDVTVPAVQDVLLDIVLDHGGPQDSRLASLCVEQRLSRKKASKELLTAIRRVPDSRWTEQLRQLHTDQKKAGNQRLSILKAVLSCANDRQLNAIIDDFSEFDRYSRNHILYQLASSNHPRHHELLSQALDSDDDADFGNGLRHVSQNPSLEILRLLLKHLEPLQKTAQSTGTLDSRSFRRAQQLLLQLAEFDHPDAQRMVNALMISPVSNLRRDAGQLMARNATRSPVRSQLSELWNAKKKQNYEESLQAVNDLIEQDPFYSEFYVFRASLLMRHDQMEESLADIQKANQLGPGDVITESTLALARVRTGKIESGLKEAEAVLERVPEQAGRMYMWTLYNTACVYGRAIEQPNITDVNRKQYRDHGMDLFRQSVDAGIHDEEHVKNDPDLIVFHDHPQWSRLIKQITENQKPSEW